MQALTRQFIIDNPNPTLGDMLSFFNSPAAPVFNPQEPAYLLQELRQALAQLTIPNGIFKLLDRLGQEIEQQSWFKAKDSIKNGLKRIQLLQGHQPIQQQINLLYQSVEGAIAANAQETPLQKALDLLEDVVWYHTKDYPALNQLKDSLNPQAFNLFVAHQTIGCVYADGWAFGVFGNNPALVPHISEAFAALNGPQLAAAMQKAISVFPADTTFLFNDDSYIATLNFIENPRRKITDARLAQYSQAEREQFCANYQKALAVLENATEALFGYGKKWQFLEKFYQENLGLRVWKNTKKPKL